ncbi:MAG: sigma-70 family RNA polymerase sigma factor [Chloroflexota bacterium]
MTADVPEQTDQEVLALATQGNREAFGKLYERYVAQIYSYIYYRTGNRHDAEDLTARVFMRAMHHIQDYKERGLPVSAWLYRIAHNLVANWHRDNSRKQEISLDDFEIAHQHEDYPETHLMQSEQSEMLIKALQDLPSERQQLIILKFVEGLSNAEIGQIMGRTEGAIKSLYHRTLYGLRDVIGVEVSEIFNED